MRQSWRKIAQGECIGNIAQKSGGKSVVQNREIARYKLCKTTKAHMLFNGLRIYASACNYKMFINKCENCIK